MFCTCLTRLSFAQNEPYPQDYFRSPINFPIVLAGNYGECRANHFHAGLDIKTKGKENEVVVAAAEGYVSRIKMEPGGYGHALYISHPNGYTTVYAHLNDFSPKIQKYLRQQQYALKKWRVDLQIAADVLPVKKGEQIAKSGNTGGSSGPHLHWEIRDSKNEHPLNPLLFGIKINDTRPPKPTRIGVYKGNVSVYQQKPDIQNLKLKNELYQPDTDTIFVQDNLMGLSIAVNDFMNGSSNTLSLHTAEWFLDDRPQGKIRIEEIGFDETRFIHAFADYSIKQTQNYWMTCLFKLPGNQLRQVYENLNAHSGKLDLSDGQAHELKIEIRDAFDNVSVIKCIVKGTKEPALTNTCDEIQTNNKRAIELPEVQIQLGNNVVYDKVCWEMKTKPESGKAISNVYQILDANIPAHERFTLRIKPTKSLSPEQKDKVVMAYSDGRSTDREAAERSHDFYQARVRKFGNYWLETDTNPPSVSCNISNGTKVGSGQRINFSVKEKETSIKSFDVWANGQWLCFEQRGTNWFYNVEEHLPKGKIQLKAIAMDENGNKKTMHLNINR